MPTYEYSCGKCDLETTQVTNVENRHNAPQCADCGGPTHFIISACAGVVKFPAGGGKEYRSPASGKMITTEKARRDDLARTGCRPYEGRAAETAEAKRRTAYEEKKADAKLEESTRKAFHQLTPEKRRQLGG